MDKRMARVVKVSSLVISIFMLLSGAYGVVIVGANGATSIAWIGLVLMAIAGGEEVVEIIMEVREGIQ